MKRATLIDLYHVYLHLSKYLGGESSDLLLRIRNLMYDLRYSFWLAEGLVVVLEVAEDCDTHILVHPYADEGSRGRVLIQALAILEELVKDSYDKVLFKPPKSAKHIRRLLGSRPGVTKVDEDTYEYSLKAGYVCDTLEGK
jgi:hypothetical protein